MAIAKSTEQMLQEVYADGRVSVGEFRQLRDTADEKCAAVEAQLGRNNDLTALQKSADVTVQLMQNVAIDIEREDLSDLGQAMVLDAMQAQFAYLRAAIDMVGQALFPAGPVGDLPD